MDTINIRCTSGHITWLGPLHDPTYAYNNDLSDKMHSSIHLFAGDCVLHREIKNMKLIHRNSAKYLNSLTKWEYDWQMHFNP